MNILIIKLASNSIVILSLTFVFIEFCFFNYKIILQKFYINFTECEKEIDTVFPEANFFHVSWKSLLY